MFALFTAQFFNSESSIRFKYGYFGHVHNNALGKNAIPLGALNADMNLLVRCARGSDDTGSRKRRHPKGLDALKHTLPRAFQILCYVEARHQELAAIVRADEEYYGRADGFDAHHLYNESMLSQKGQQHYQLQVGKLMKEYTFCQKSACSVDILAKCTIWWVS